MRNTLTLAVLSAAALGTAAALADETTLTRGNIRVTAEFDVDMEVEDVVIETRTLDGWRVDAFETEDAQEAIAMGDTAPLAGRVAAIAAACGPQCTILDESEAATLWNSLQSLSLPGSSPDGPLLKVPITLSRLPEIERALAPITSARHYSVAGNLALIAPSDEAATAQTLDALGLPALRLRGQGAARIGARPSADMEDRTARAMDPDHRFVPLPE